MKAQQMSYIDNLTVKHISFYSQHVQLDLLYKCSIAYEL